MNRWSIYREVLLAVLLLAVFTRPGGATTTRVGTAAKLANALNGQPNHIAFDDKHNVYLVVWSDAGVGGHCYGRWVDAVNDLPIGPAFQVSRGEQLYATMPRVAYSSGTADDVFIVTYRSDVNQYDRGANIYAQRLRFNATQPALFDYVGEPFEISNNSTNPAAAQYPGGIAYNKLTRQFLVTWWQDYNREVDAFARAFTVDGKPVNNDKNVSATTAWQGAPNVAFDPVTNRYLVVYQGDDPSGMYVGTWGRLIDGTTADPIGETLTFATGGFQAEQSVVYLPERQAFLVMWTTVPHNMRTVTGRLVDSNGIPLAPQYPLVSFDGVYPVPTGAPTAAYNPVTRSVLMACMDDVYVWGSELDGAGAVRQTLQLSSAPPTTGTWTPNVAAGYHNKFGMSYVLNQAAVWFEQFQGTAQAPLPEPTPRTPPTDFNADGKADILWWHAATGESSVWYMNGTTVQSIGAVAGQPDVNWKMAGSADFDADGKPDIVWRNAITGENSVWFMDGASHLGSAVLPPVDDLTWEIVAVGDISGDRKPDVLWRNGVTGQNILWIMDGVAYQDHLWLPDVPDVNWRIVGTADINVDGHGDAVWHNMATGSNVVWYLRQGTYVGWDPVTSVPDVRWVPVAVADFSGDGRADLLWRNIMSGQDIIWLMNGPNYVDYAWLPTEGNLNWTIGTSVR